MASTTELLASFKNLFPQAGSLLESYGAVARDGLLADSVRQATADGISIEFKGYSKDTYPGTIINSIYMPEPIKRTLSASDAMTYFLFETRNAMRAKKYCELYKKAALGQIDSNSFARLMGEYESRGGLEIGKMWQQIVDRYGVSKKPSSGISKYHYDQYLSAPSWETNTTQLNAIINSNLSSIYSSGSDQGKSRQWYYVNRIFSEKVDPQYKPYWEHPTFAMSIYTQAFRILKTGDLRHCT